MISQDLELSIQKAFVMARAHKHEFLTVEHLLLALLDDPSAKAVLLACHADLEALKLKLVTIVQENTPVLDDAESEDIDTQPTLGFQRVIQRAVLSLSELAHSEKGIEGAHVLVSLFSETESDAVFVLQEQGITRLTVTRYLSHGLPEADDPSQLDDALGYDQFGEKQTSSALARYTVCYNELARQGKIDPLIGRDSELERLVQVLCRRRKNNPLLVGEAGVGKTAIAEGLAQKIIENNVPDMLSDAEIYGLDLGALIAGAKFRGDFEQRLKNLLNELAVKPQAILFIDEIHSLIGAGASSGNTMDASNLLKPALSSGRLRCMGATTYKEYRGVFEKDHALSRRFQKIEVAEPSIGDTVAILKGLKAKFEAHHQVKYSTQALVSAAELSARYLTERYLPDKAIDIIDEAGAAQRLLPKSKQKKTIGKIDIEGIISKIARVPAHTVSADDINTLASLERELKTKVFGQEQAIEAVADAIKMARSGLGKTDKPIGAFLFSGPTGVGKTEVANQLANILGVGLIRFDMSEYLERHAISRLIGAPPGYVGFEQGGLLTEHITKTPHAVLLLDEIEKAHPDILNILLQVMDNGVLTDNNGRKADFRNCVIIMTTNVGAHRLTTAAIGFHNRRQAGDEMDDIKRVFSPEFRNRLDAIIPFAPLNTAMIARIVDKFLHALKEQLHHKGVEATFTDDLRAYLAHNGVDPLMGARPMQRLIQSKVRKALAEEILFGKLSKGGRVTVGMGSDHAVTLALDKSE